MKELVGENAGEELEEVEFAEFRVVDLFEIEKTTSFNKDSLASYSDNNKYPYITRTSVNNGVNSYTGLVPGGTLNERNTFSLGLLQMDFFYQKEPWYAGQFVRKIKPTIEMNELLILYFQTLFMKIRPTLLSGLVRDVDDTFRNTKASLPIHPENTSEPYWEFMEKYIQRMQQEYIKRKEAENDNQVQLMLDVAGIDLSFTS